MSIGKPTYRGFLHRHPKLEDQLKLDSEHVIIDKLDWERIRSFDLVIYFRKYKDELPEDGENIISFSKELHEKYGNGIIADKFNLEVWNQKDDKEKCDYWIPDKDLIAIIPLE